MAETDSVIYVEDHIRMDFITEPINEYEVVDAIGLCRAVYARNHSEAALMGMKYNPDSQPTKTVKLIKTNVEFRYQYIHPKNEK